MLLVESYSPEFKLKKANNYDNTIANAPRQVLEENNIQKYYSRKPAFSTQRDAKDAVVPKYVNLGCTTGPGGRAVLYGTARKELFEKKKSSHNTSRISKSSKVHTRN